MNMHQNIKGTKDIVLPCPYVGGTYLPWN